MKQPAARLLSSAAGPAGVCCCRFNKTFWAKIALVAILFFSGVFPALAINAPTITHVAGVAVTPDTTMYSNQADFQVRGNAEAGTEVKLYRATTLIGTTTTSGLGVWTVNLVAQAQGSFQYTATAYDGLFTSEKSVAVPVIVDITPPSVSIQYGSTGCRSNSKYQCNNIGYLRFAVTDPLAGPDFSTAQITVDYADVPGDGNPDDYVVSAWYSLAGYTQNNGINEVSFFSNTGFGTINQNYRKVRIIAKIYDRAGNETTQVTMFYNNARANQVAAIVEKVWDPGHNVFTGTGEPTSNLPDAEGWVNYYPYMTVVNNPPKIRARAEKWSPANQSFHAWDVYCETYNRTFDIDQATGRFIVTYPVLPYGDVSLNFGPRGGDCRPGKYTNIRLKTTSGAPNSIRSWGPYSGEQKIIGSRVWPDFYGKVSKMPFNQTVQIGYGDYSYTTWKPSLSQVVLPQGESYPGTAGVYNHGDVWYDANDNGDWDEGELFHDMPAQISDGESFNLVNFREVLYNANTAGSTLGGLVRNSYGKSTATRIVRYHHNEKNPPNLNEATLLPTVPTGQYRRTANKPSEIVVKTNVWGATWSGFYFLKGDPNSKIRLFNGTNNEIALPTTTWTSPSALNYQTSMGISGITLPDATYRVDVRLEDSFNLVTEDSTRWFIIDNVPPAAAEMVPSDGADMNSYTSFNAKVVDPMLPDGTPGSGANIDVAKAQIWPYKKIGVDTPVTRGGQKDWDFVLVGGDSRPMDSTGNLLANGSKLELWTLTSGTYEAVTGTATIRAIYGDGTIQVRNDAGNFVNGYTYALMLPVTFFTSNNGVDRVGAVPVNTITADGTYVTKVVTRDRSDNTGTYFVASSKLEIAFDNIDFTLNQPFLFAGLVPADIATFTTSAIKTRKGTVVKDGQSLSLVQSTNIYTLLVPDDANGIPGDGHQVLIGRNGAPAGTGQACFGVEVKTTSYDKSLTVFGVIGLASGTSPIVWVRRINTFTAAPQVDNVEITPANPNPVALVTTSFLGRETRAVPDGSLATCTTNFGTILNDDDPARDGIQVAAVNGSATARVTSDVKGTATVSFTMGGRSANGVVTFVDKYPPPAPMSLALTPQYSNTGSSLLTWNPSLDVGGAGTSLYTIERSSYSGTTWSSYAVIGTSDTNSFLISGLVDGQYRFRVKAQDADGNVGNYSIASPNLIVDRVAPAAVACSDVGAGNNDPDEIYSYDSNIYFYYTATDDRSGPGEVNIQIAISTDTADVVEDVWAPVASSYLFVDGQGFRTYYARVRVKDKAGNVGNWGSWSNGMTVSISGATAPPNAPTIARVDGKNAVPGVPLPTNKTSNILMEGLSEAYNLILLYVNGAYVGSVISNAAGEFSTTFNLVAGTHKLKVKAHNGFAESAFSNTITIVIDQTKPGISRVVYDIPGFTRGGYYFGTTSSDHNLGTFDFYLSDSGGSGFDISSFKAVLTEIEDDGTLVTPVAPYKNPVTSSIGIIAADRVRLLPDGAWKDCLQTGHRYRIAYEVSDFASNKTTATFDFVIDNTKPGLAEEVPADTAPANCNIKSIYVYDYEKYPSGYPPVAALVPYKWDASVNAFMIAPDFVDDTLVDRTTTPHALKFNTLALYGTLYAADPSEPSPQKGRDTKTESINIAWGYGSGITAGPDTLGNYKSFRFPFRTVTNGLTSETLVDQDRAICRNNYTIRFWVNSGDPAPSAPLSVQFCNASNQAMTYSVWTSYGSLFGSSGGSIRDREIIVTDNSEAMLATVRIPVEMFSQRVEVYRNGVGVIASATVSPGNDTANLLIDYPVIDYPEPCGSMLFQIRTYANGYYSTNLPKYLNYYWYYWVKGDTAAPYTFELYPTDTYFNGLSGADARPFPSQFSVKAKDTANGSVLSFLEISKTEISFIGATGVLSRDYDTSRMEYGYRYQLSAVPTAEGTYYYKVVLPDAARPTSHTTTAQFPFKLDKTPPVPVVVNPSDGTTTNSLPSFNAQIRDPNLADGTPGSGPNMDPSRVQIFPFKSLGTAAAAATNALTVTVYGVDVIATDHVDKAIPVNTVVKFAKALAGGKYEFPTVIGKITANGSDKITASVTSGSLVVGTTYAILYEIPTFASNDGTDKIAAVPVQAATKGGAYLVFLKLMDKALNQGAYSSSSSIYEAAYGSFTLTPSRTKLYAGLYPPHTATVVSSPILTTEGNPIMAGTEVTVLSNRGSFTPADSNGIPGDGHQVQSDSAGKLNFGLQATGLSLGYANVRAVLGLASATNNAVQFVQIPQFSVSCSVEELIISPSTPNPSTTFTTSALGNSGDLVPANTAVNVWNDLGTFSPADAYTAVEGYQAKTNASGICTFSLSSNVAGVASITMEAGGRYVYKTISFVDRYPPNAPTTPTLDNVLNNNGVFSLFWGTPTDPGGSGISAYGVEYSLNGGAYTHLATSTTTGFVTSNLAQGVYRFRVRAVDGAGNVGAYSGVSVQAEVDKTPPIGSIVINGGAARTKDPNVTLTLSATDAKGVADMSFSNDGINWSGWVAYATSRSWILSAGDENKVVYARFRDTVGNISINTDDILYDTTGPVGTVNIAPSPYSNVTDLDVTFTAIDVSGVSKITYRYDGETWKTEAFTAYKVWSVNNNYATRTVDVKFEDSLGNVSGVYTAQTCVDTGKPAKVTVTDDGDYSPYLDKLHATWTASSDGQTGISHYLVCIGKSQGAADVVAETNVGNIRDMTFGPMTLDITGSTIYYFTVYAVDRAGNRSDPAYSNGIKGGDPSPPLAVTVTDEGNFTADNTKLSATWNASSDPDSGISRYEVSIGTTAGGTNVLNWVNNSLNLSYTATGLNLAHNTTYYINVRIYNGGGTTTVCSSNGIKVDTAAPPVPTMLAEPAYSSGTVNIVGCAAVTDPVSGGVTYYFERATNSAFSSGLANSGWISANTYTFSGLSNGTTYYFRVRARDAVLNTSAYSTAVSSIQDSNAPTATNYTDNVALNNDPDHVWSRNATVSFAATGLADNLSGVKDVFVEISNTSNFSTILWSGWTGNTTGAKTFTVSSPVDGNVIYARAKYEDVAGNYSSAWQTTDGITLDLTDPVAGATTDAVAGNNDPNHSVSKDANIYFDFTHSDSVSGVADVHIQIARDTGFTQIATSTLLGGAVTSYHYKFGEDGKTYYARIRVRDNSGRYSDGTLAFSPASSFGARSDGIRVDLTPPSFLDAPFFINKKADAYLGESTTATSVVHLTFTVDDPSGVAKVQVSNNGTTWTTWNSPVLDPASYSWTLDLVPGLKTVWVMVTDGIGHTTSPASQTIEYWPGYQAHKGTRDERSYPTDTYDEYSGQNKYGSPRTDPNAPSTGVSLRLEKK